MTDFEFGKAYVLRLMQLEKRHEKAAEEGVDEIKVKVNQHLSALMQMEQEHVIDDMDSEHRDEITEFIREWRDKH